MMILPVIMGSCTLAIAAGLMLMADKFFEPQIGTNKRLPNNLEHLAHMGRYLLMEVTLSPPLVYPAAMSNIPGDRFTDNYVDSCQFSLEIFAGR